MASLRSDNMVAPPSGTAASTAPPTTVKIVIAGGFAVGKTTFVSSISDITPLTTEAAMTSKSIGVDNAGQVSDRKMTTTVAMDFGRIALPGNLWLYLFGTPGQDRFSFMWDDLIVGSIGAVVLVDTSRFDDCFGAVDYFEQHRLPFIVAVNCFDGKAFHDTQEIRQALNVPGDTPVVYTDARSREATKQTLLTLVRHSMKRASEASVAT